MKKKIECLIIVICCSVFCNAPQAIAQTISYFATGEEFSGPLPTWKNIKTDFGAKGDGITDDAPAITAALYTFKDIGNIKNSVLYFPEGTYRLGSTILNADRGNGGTDYMGLAIIGEDPSNTILLWDGPADGTMFRLDGWHLKVNRLTFDGQNKAKIGILREGSFGTSVEYSDLVFKDINLGVQLGSDSSAGQAENLFLRCRFFNCGVGIFGPNMNSLDIWLWYCLFQDCSFGVHCGGYQAYGNVFLRSKICDLGLSWQPASIVNNISVNTKRFNRDCGTGLFQGNEIYDPDTTIVRNEWYLLDTLKAFTVPYISVLLDNIVKTSGNAGAAIELSDGKCISVGNTFSQLWPIRPRYQPFTRGLYWPVQLAVDGNKKTFYSGSLFARLTGIAWHCPSGTARIAIKYSISASLQSERDWDPKSFRLVGSNDWGYHVTLLDSQMNQSWTIGEAKTYTFQNSTPFSMYRLDVMENTKGEKPGDGEFFQVAEFSLIDTAGVNIINEPGGFLAGSDETWGKYYSLQEKKVPYSSITKPEAIELPGTPPLVTRKIFEVRKGTSDDAAEIQKNIDSAAALPLGTRPIVHIPKGIYSINKTLILPANVEMTLSGDGLYLSGTFLLPDPGLSGPTMKIASPSHLLVRDIAVEGNEAIYAEVDDKPGSRVTGTLFNVGGWDPNNMANTAMIIDGIEQSYMLFSGVLIGNCYNGVLVKGGSVLSSGGSTGGQIAFLGGASGFGQNMWETQKNGKLIAQGMWYEADIDYTKSFINLTGASSGSLAIGGMTWCYAANPDRPIVSIDNFSGQFTAIANTFVRYDIPQWWQLTGDGARGRILSACNGWSLGSDSAAIVNKWPYWFDQTSPSAAASRIFCEGPEITDKMMNTLPDSSSLLSSLALMRSLRIKKPTAPLTEDSHLDFIRVNAHCTRGQVGTAVRFIAIPDPYGRPESPTLVSPLNGSTDVTTNPTMNWNASTGASSYRLQVSQSTSFNPVVFEDYTISATKQEIDPLIDNTVYYWRVLAKNSNGSSTWSPVWSFTTGTNTSVEQISTEIPTEFYLGNNYPNPFYQNTSIVYSIPLKAKVTLMLFDAWGREIAILVDEEQIAGKYEVKVDGSKLPGGIYYYRMQSGAYSETRKMVLIK
ncbi:MAG: T9SS type A sorting domain-containing protein [Bacteroidales bacterium]|nr:T9SS type A sorting domain-containing protein [Bacteroidales bacterium]